MNGRICILAAVLAGAASPAPALAETWVNIGKNTNGSVYDIDWDSIRRNNDVVTFTLRTQYGPDSPPGESDGYVAHRQANCAARTYADLQTDYMKNGSVRNSSGKEDERSANPGSIAEAMLDKVCAH